MSKPSATENQYFRVIGERMEVGELRCRCYPQLVAVERHHTRAAVGDRHRSQGPNRRLE